MKKTINVANVLLENTSFEILLLQRSPKLKRAYIWGFPGGMIDKEETATHAAIRELGEETSIQLAHLAVIGIKRFLIEMPDENVKITNIHASLTRSAEITINPNEHIAYKWASENDIYNSSDLLPCIPSIVSETLSNRTDFQDLTIKPGIKLILL